VVTGCYAQRAPQELAGLAGVAAVVGNSHKALAPEIVLGLALLGCGTAVVQHAESLLKIRRRRKPLRPQAPMVGRRPLCALLFEGGAGVPGAQTRPNLKIQEGCGNRCTFCVIPQTRGSSKSLPAAAVLKQVEGFVAAGGNELVLSGINLGRWGRDLESLMRRNPAEANARWGWCGRFLSRRLCRGCGSVPLSRWTGMRS
jgi:threonylcarbamoyladenosine tRNA methylthiotransferase MtaB